MPMLDSVPITSCHECVATLTLPLALFLLLAETAAGGMATVAYLRLAGGLTHGFLKFVTVTYAILATLAFLVALAGPPGLHDQLLSINQAAGSALVVLQGLLVVALIAHAVVIWRRDSSTASWSLTLCASVLLLAGIVSTLWPLTGSFLGGIAIAFAVTLSAVTLGAATTGMLLGHWYLVTPALTNRPLLRAIGVLLAGLVLQAILFPLMLRGLAHASGSLTHPLALSPVLSILWGLGAVVLPLVAAGLAFATCRLRSFMSTTGLLYLAMIAILPGQLVGLLLFFTTASA
jgi:hypothetical protein